MSPSLRLEIAAHLLPFDLGVVEGILVGEGEASDIAEIKLDISGLPSATAGEVNLSVFITWMKLRGTCSNLATTDPFAMDRGVASLLVKGMCKDWSDDTSVSVISRRASSSSFTARILSVMIPKTLLGG